MMGRVARNSEAGAGERGLSAPQVGVYNSDVTDVHGCRRERSDVLMGLHISAFGDDDFRHIQRLDGLS